MYVSAAQVPLAVAVPTHEAREAPRGGKQRFAASVKDACFDIA